MQKDVENDMKEKRAPQSWMRTFLESRGSWGFQYELEGAYAVGMHGIAGALTIAAPMQTFCLAMCHYPQYLPMLQEELERVCGDRLPRADDRPNLPFLRAIIRECLRWRPPVPTGIPHYLTQDDTYNGYHIPAGSVMHPLEWAISRDPTMFPDPESFNPLRWLEPSYPTYQEPLTQYPTIINCTQFGYGRRVCQGQTVADEDLLIGIGSIAWLFDISKHTNEAETESCSDSGYDSQSETEEISEKESLIHSNKEATISSEELNTGIEITASFHNEKSYKYTHPGAWPADPLEEQLMDVDKRRGSVDSQRRQPKPKLPTKAKKGADTIDPTLDFTTLLIAKPVPFEFNLKVRDEARAQSVRQLFEDGKNKGEYKNSRGFWGEDQGKNKELGWGKV